MQKETQVITPLLREARMFCRVLLIEDDLNFARTVRARLRLCKRMRFEVTHLGSLDHANRYLGNGKVDLIVLDLGLPESSGLETFSAVREIAPKIPIVVLSGSKDDDLAIEALRQGAQDYLMKGQDDAEVLARVLQHSLERHKIQEKLNHAASQLMKVNCQLESLSRSDPLTDLLNRRGLQQALSREIRWADRQGSETSVLLFDLDDFKEVNDRYGYAVGDIILKEIAKRLQATVRLTDYVARIGGDEFIILLPQTSMKNTLQVAEKIRWSICGQVVSLPLGSSLHVTASIGAALATRETPSIDELLSKMHPLLSSSKRRGKNRISCHSHHLGRKPADSSGLSQVVEGLREGKNLYAVKQPILRLEDRRMVGYELLSRCGYENFKTPDIFFRLSTEHNILTLVDHHCYKTCIDLSEEISAGLSCHINLFPSTLIDIPTEHLIDELPASPRNHFCVEISEQQIIGNPSYLVEHLRALRNHGISIAVDDVGFGRSCLENLILLEPHVIKVDKKCIQNISQDKSKIKSFERLLKVVRALEADLIAEGIETEEDLQILQSLGVRYGQGYLFGRPF